MKKKGDRRRLEVTFDEGSKERLLSGLPQLLTGLYHTNPLVVRV